VKDLDLKLLLGLIPDLLRLWQMMVVTVKMKSTTSIRNSISKLQFKWYTTPTEEPQTQQTLPHRLQQLDSSYYVSQTMTTTGCEGPRTEIIITITVSS
jgi:hypothetical protein